MPREKVSQFDVVCGLKELSDDADCSASELKFEGNGVFVDWFAAIKETLVKIRDCEILKDLKDIEYPPCPVFEENQNKNVDSGTPQTLRENVHAKVLTPVANKTPKKFLKEAECRERDIKCNEIAADFKDKSSDRHTTTQSNSSANVLNKAAECQVRVIGSDEVDADCQNKPNESHAVNPSNSPVKLNNSVVKLERNDVPKLDVTYNLCTPESDKPESQNLYQTPAFNQTFNKIINKTLILDSVFSDNGNSKSKKVNNDSGVITRSASKKNTPVNNGSVRSGCKRKSSSGRDENSKKPRNNVTAVGPDSKTAQSKYPIRKAASKKTLNADNKTKVEAVIVPSVKPKQSVVSKEQQILEEIKKKEEKANLNIKRVLAERQQKAEQNKKNREEKRTKMLQKKLQLEKEKEVRLEKHETEVRTSQVKSQKENPAGKTRTKELIEHHLKENKLSGLSVSKQSDTIMNNAVKTPVNKIVEEEDDCYELTPLPNSSTYNFSDDEEDEKTKGKHIPLWAQGVLLKHALIQQYYQPVDTDELFGSQIDTPNLPEIFQVNKKRYLKRTSSANWNSPPLSTSFKR